MPSDAETIAELMRPLFATRDPFVEARRLGLVLVPIPRALGRLVRYRNDGVGHCGAVEYDPTLPANEQCYSVGRAVVHCVLSKAGMLRELSAQVPLRELTQRLFVLLPTSLLCDQAADKRVELALANRFKPG